MKTVRRNLNYGHSHNYTFDSGIQPVVSVVPGEPFAIETEDTYNGMLRAHPERLQPRDVKPYTDHVPFWYNPLCGPIYVDGADKGDVLAVRILSIDEMSSGSVATVPRAHHFSGLRGWEETDEMYTGIIENDSDSSFQYGPNTYRWQPRPFVGTIGTAPQHEVLSSLVTSFGSVMAAGGNLDCCAVAPGSTVYLQSLNEGGLLYLGDVHASQGDGEVCGVANEVAATVKLECQVIKNKRLRNVRIVNDESLISVFCYRPMEEAFRQAMRDLILWLEEDYGLTRRESYLLMSVCPDFRLRTYQMCAGLGRLEITVGAEFPRHLLQQ